MNKGLVAALAAGLLSAGAVHAQPPPPAAGPGARPAADIARDAARRPAEVIAFAHIKPGDTVIEMIPGAGYFTRLLSAAVGPGGKVYAVVPTFLADRFPDALTAIKTVAASPGYGNVTVVVEGLGKLPQQGPADVVFTAQNYHDLHNPAVPPDTAEKVDEAVFAALKPGGVYLVEDHVGAAGTGATQGGTLHRIEPGFARAEIEKAGFVFEADSTVLANPADPHAVTVFDPAVRGHTDQFLFRFRKPAATADDALSVPAYHRAEVLAFAGVKPGDRVADIIAGRFLRAFSQAVGPTGVVYDVEPSEVVKVHGEVLTLFTHLHGDPAYRNIDLIQGPIDATPLPRNLDVVFIRQNYHDLHDRFMGPADVAGFNRKVFAALRPGGVYVVLDHVAATGSGLRDTDTLHRIDPAAVKAEVTAAGFVFDGASPVLANPADPHDRNVFDASIRGHTDQFLFRFRKPG